MKARFAYFRLIWAFLLLFLSGQLQAQGIYLNKLPNTTVNAITEDHQGFLWIGTTHGLSRYDGYNYLTFYTQNNDYSLVNDAIQVLMTDAQGRVWVSTECGLSVYENGRFRHPAATSYNVKFRLLDLDENTLLAADRQGVELVDKATFREGKSFSTPKNTWPFLYYNKVKKQIWVICPNPELKTTITYVFDRDLKLLRTSQIDKVVTDMQPGNDGLLWLLFEGRLACYDSNSQKQVSLPADLEQMVGSRHVDFICLAQDGGSLAFGIKGVGMCHFDLTSHQFETYNTIRRQVPSAAVSYLSSRGTLWLSDKGGNFTSFTDSHQFDIVEMDDYALTIASDHQNQIWFRSFGHLYHMDPQTRQITTILSDEVGEFLIDEQDHLCLIINSTHLKVYDIHGKNLSQTRDYEMDEAIFSVCRDKQNRLWLATPKSLGLIDENGQLKTLPTPDNVVVTGMYEALPAHDLIMTTENGVVYRLQGDKFQIFDIPVKNPTFYYHETNSPNLFIGSYNEGVTIFNLETGKSTNITTKDNLAENHVKTILKDKEGNFWFGGPNTISRLSLADSTITHVNDASRSGGLLYAGSCIDEQNRLYYAGARGLTIIDPADFRSKQLSTQVAVILDGIYMNGQEFEWNKEQKLVFPYQQSLLLFRFVGVDLEDGEHLKYEYRLEGYDSQWILADDSRRALYSQLPAGKYTLRVRTRLENGNWSPNDLRLPFVVECPPWATWWAICLYLLFALGLVLLGIYLYIKWRLQRANLKLSQQREELKQEHIDFMTNLSHEIRTPLVLIYAPLKDLLKDTTISENGKNLIQLMLHNTEKLRHLVSQIMTTDHPDTKERLHVAESRMDIFIRNLVDNFRFVAQERQLDLQLGHMDEFAPAWYDAEKVEKILCNFLSNAIKYTPENGHIRLDFKIEDGKAVVNVTDDGPGIPQDKQQKIFDRYYRLDSEGTPTHAGGHGIGLNYSMFLARLHKGDVLYNQVQPHGSVFTLIIPVSKDSYSADEFIDNADLMLWSERTLQPKINVESGSKEQTVLIVEDNTDVLQYLHQLFAEEFNVMMAPDGEEALEALRLSLPDMVVTDVIMPRKDGFELCRDIKQDENLRLIPVLMLTAKTDSQNHIHGLDCGADAFVGKPFDPDVLLATVRNLLKQRGLLQEMVRNTTSMTLSELDKEEEGDQTILTERDRVFMENLYKAIDAHLSENEFNVNELAKELLVSYSLLYNKVKALTGETPQHFLTTYRMNRAMELLKTRKYTVSEVCYMVGASSPANFSKAFRKQFDVAPSSVLA